MKTILIESGNISMKAELDGSPAAEAIHRILPVSGHANLWGEEIYFSIPVHVDEAEDARQDMEVGELAFWPAGDAFCIFFGPTPVSVDEVPRAYSPVNSIGKVLGDPRLFKKITNGDIITIKREVVK